MANKKGSSRGERAGCTLLVLAALALFSSGGPSCLAEASAQELSDSKVKGASSGANKSAAGSAKPASKNSVEQKDFANLLFGTTTVKLKRKFADKIEHVKGTGVVVFYPLNVPSRYSEVEVSYSDQSKDDKKHPDYQLQFRNPKNGLKVTVETAYTGIGDGPDGDRQLNAKTKVFGDVAIYVFKPGSEGNGSKHIYYLSNWVKPIKTKTNNDTRRDYHFLGEGISDKEAIAIVQSLTALSK